MESSLASLNLQSYRMKQIFTLLALFASSQLFAQFTENFENNITSLTSNCWTADQVAYTTTKQDVITGNGSAYTNPPTSGTGERTLSTPFLDMTSTSLNVSFNYKVSSKINGNATRTLRIGITDKNGVFTQLDLITLNSSTATSVFNYNKTFTLSTTGVYRLELRIGGATGDGNSRFIFDDLYVSASAHYGPTSHCNPAPVAVNDTYNIPYPSVYSGNLFTNDNIPADGDTYAAVVVTDSTQGTLVVNTDGTFTFTPASGFLGGTVTFTYQINDNGYTPQVSNIATVTLNFAAASILPMQLQKFSAKLVNNKVELSWAVAENEAGRYFEIQASADGRNFSVAGMIFTDSKSGTQVYHFSETFTGNDTYYRIRLVNASHAESYSKIQLVKAASGANDLMVYGNPVQQQLNFTYTTSVSVPAVVSVYNMAGIKVYTSKMILNAGTNQLRVPMTSQLSGNYILEVSAGNTKSVTRVVKK